MSACRHRAGRVVPGLAVVGREVLVLDRGTGQTTVLPSLDSKTVPQVVALDHHNAAVYVRAREGYNFSMLGRDYEQVARMSTPETWAPYSRRFVGNAAMHEKLADRELHRITVISVRLVTGYVAGAAGEALGYDRLLKSNTAKRRTHSLFRQGCMLYDLIPTMPDKRLLPLVESFAEMLAEVPVFADTFGAI